MNDTDLLLFARNGMVSKDGKIAVVLAPPPSAEATHGLQTDMGPLADEANLRGFGLWLGVAADDTMADALVVAVDLDGQRGQGFLGRLAGALRRHGVAPLQHDVDRDKIFELAKALIAMQQEAT